MKTQSEENHDLIRWLDDEMTAAERAQFESAMKNDPELAAEAASMRQLSASLREHLPSEMPVPHADFFNSQITLRIAQMAADDEKPQIQATSWLDWFRAPWLAATAAAACAVAGFLFMQNSPDISHTAILSSYTPNPSVKAQVSYSDAAQATVLTLDGLEAIPADKKIAGFSVHRAEVDQEVATTTLYDQSGGILLVLAKDAKGQPMLWNR